MGIRPGGIKLKIMTCLRENRERRRVAGRGAPFPPGLESFDGQLVCGRRGHPKMKDESQQVTV